MKTHYSIIFFCLFLAFFTLGCKKEYQGATELKQLCKLVNSGEFDKTILVMNGFLSSIPSNISAEIKLDRFTAWLSSSGCIAEAKLLCNSCIYTFPAQSEVYIRFSTGSEEKEKVLDILMSDPLKALDFHE